MGEVEKRCNRLHREQPQPNYDKRLRETIRFLERKPVEQRKSAGQQMTHLISIYNRSCGKFKQEIS